MKAISDTMKLTTLHLFIFLHYANGSNEDFTPRTSSVIGCMNDLVSAGLLRMDGTAVLRTEKGVAFLLMLLNTPMPEMRFMDPRTDSLIPIP